MRLKAQNEMAGLWPHAAMGPVERMVRHPSLVRYGAREYSTSSDVKSFFRSCQIILTIAFALGAYQ